MYMYTSERLDRLSGIQVMREITSAQLSRWPILRLQEELDRAAFERFGQHHYVKNYMSK